MIVIFDQATTDFSTNGLGALIDATECTVTEERNGKFELEMTYPITGRNYDKFAFRRIILAKSNPFADPQPFRIYAISKPINGLVTVNAEHISYDLSGYSVSPFTASNITSAFLAIQQNAIPQCPFNFWTDKTTVATMNIKTPCSVRAALGGVEGSVLDTYRGEFEFDGLTVKLYNNRGANNGVTIRYGKNLTDLTQEENCADVYTAVYPYWYSEEEGLVELTEKIVNVEGTFGFTKILTLDLTEEFEEKPTESQLRSKANSYISSHDLGIPKVSLTVSFLQLSNSEEYKMYSLLETVRLCDTVTVIFPKLGVNAAAKCVTTKYDVIADKYLELELGDTRSDIVKTISVQEKTIQKVPTKSFLEQAITSATNLITGNSGGYVVLHSTDPNSDQPSEILIMDTPDIETSNNIWRWNSGGLGYSSEGYSGDYGIAITMDGSINASFITSGQIEGGLIKGETITSNALSQAYKAEVTNEIGESAEEVTQAFVAADEHLQSVITNVKSDLSSDISSVESQVSELEQTIDSLSIAFAGQTTGGINLLHNSSGLNGMSDDWDYTGEAVALQTAEAVNNTSSGSMFRLRESTLSQTVNVISGKDYTLTFKAFRDTIMRSYVRITDGGIDDYIFNEQSLSDDWEEYAYTFTASGDSIILTAGTDGYYLYVADFMLVEGTQKSNWTPAPNEIYTTNVKIDRRGINITNSESSTETIIDNTQFAVRHRGDIVLTVNKDLTTLKKTDITGELTIGKGKFVPRDNGVNFILLD